jgi:hypothetical protein
VAFPEGLGTFALESHDDHDAGVGQAQDEKLDIAQAAGVLPARVCNLKGKCLRRGLGAIFV